MLVYLIYLILLLFKNSYSNIHLRFNKYLPMMKEPKNITLEEFINYRVKNIYKTNIMLGDPAQNIPGFLLTNEHCFLISSNNCPEKNYFDKEKSKSFIDNNKTISEKFYFYRSYYSPKYYIEINNFTISINGSIDNSFCFHIGTQLFSKAKETNLITELHKKGIIKSYNYYFKIYSEDEVYLILDAVINDKENLNYKYINPLSDYYNYQLRQRWGLKFKNIHFGNSIYYYTKEIIAEFDINLGCIIGTFFFKDSFEKYLKENKIYVEPKDYKNKYYVYFFEKDLKGIELIKNITIKFYHSELIFINCF